MCHGMPLLTLVLFRADVGIHVEVDQNPVIRREERIVIAHDDMVIDGPVAIDKEVSFAHAPSRAIFEINVAVGVVNADDPMGIGAEGDRANNEVCAHGSVCVLIGDIKVAARAPAIVGADDDGVVEPPGI